MYPFQTPPSVYRRQVDQVQYNSLPRQSFPTLVQSTNNSHHNGSINADLDLAPLSPMQQQQQQTPPKQRTVAFGKGFAHSYNSPSYYSTPTIHHAGAMEEQEGIGRRMIKGGGGGGGGGEGGQGVTAYSTNNIYHHQLVIGGSGGGGIGQLQQQLQQYPPRGLEKQRGYSVPNLGGASLLVFQFTTYRLGWNVTVLCCCGGASHTN